MAEITVKFNDEAAVTHELPELETEKVYAAVVGLYSQRSWRTIGRTDGSATTLRKGDNTVIVSK